MVVTTILDRFGLFSESDDKTLIINLPEYQVHLRFTKMNKDYVLHYNNDNYQIAYAFSSTSNLNLFLSNIQNEFSG